MSDIPCSCVYTNGTRWDDQECPHPEHGVHTRPDRTVRIGARCYYPGELIDTVTLEPSFQ